MHNLPYICAGMLSKQNSVWCGCENFFRMLFSETAAVWCCGVSDCLLVACYCGWTLVVTLTTHWWLRKCFLSVDGMLVDGWAWLVGWPLVRALSHYFMIPYKCVSALQLMKMQILKLIKMSRGLFAYTGHDGGTHSNRSPNRKRMLKSWIAVWNWKAQACSNFNEW